jgi:DNA-binding response OmpR family regulator
MAAARLLIVEDDLKTAAALASGLERGGFSTATAHTGEEGFFLLNAETFDLVVLDWMLPGRSGIEILNEGQGINLIHTVRGVGFVLREEANA